MLIQQIIPEWNWENKCYYEMEPIGICIHNTANDAAAQNEIYYMSNNTNEVSFHIAIDDIESIQAIPFNRNSWHSGDGGSGEGNRKYISIEICYSKSGGERFVKAEQRAAKEVAELLKQFGWTINNIKKHQDFSEKYCPHRTLDMGWERFLNMVQSELNGLLINPPITSGLYRVRRAWIDLESQKGAYTCLNNAKKECDKHTGYSVFNSDGMVVYTTIKVEVPKRKEEYIISQYSESGIFNCTEDSINFRNKPYVGNDNPVQGKYYRGEKVNYDYVVITNKYTWVSWISTSSGIRRYMPIFDRMINEKWGYCL